MIASCHGLEPRDDMAARIAAVGSEAADVQHHSRGVPASHLDPAVVIDGQLQATWPMRTSGPPVLVETAPFVPNRLWLAMAKLAVPGHCILPCGQKSSPVHTASSRWSCSAPGTAPIVLTAERTPQPPSGRQARSARQCQQVGYRSACHRCRCTLDLRPPAHGRHAALARDQERRKGRPGRGSCRDG